MKHASMFFVLLLLAIACAVLVACQPVKPLAETVQPRQLQGEIFLPGVEQWGGVAVSLRFDVREVNPETHEAAGFVDWRNFQPQPPDGEPYWKAVDGDARYIFFGADVPGGDPNTVVVIPQITSKLGWGQGEPGEYGYFWFRDGGETEPDQWGMRYYSMDPWYEFYPAGQPPIEPGYFTAAEMQADDPVLPLDIEGGNLTISQ